MRRCGDNQKYLNCNTNESGSSALNVSTTKIKIHLERLALKTWNEAMIVCAPGPLNVRMFWHPKAEMFGELMLYQMRIFKFVIKLCKN